MTKLEGRHTRETQKDRPAVASFFEQTASPSSGEMSCRMWWSWAITSKAVSVAKAVVCLLEAGLSERGVRSIQNAGRNCPGLEIHYEQVYRTTVATICTVLCEIQVVDDETPVRTERRKRKDKIYENGIAQNDARLQANGEVGEKVSKATICQLVTSTKRESEQRKDHGHGSRRARKS